MLLFLIAAPLHLEGKKQREGKSRLQGKNQLQGKKYLEEKRIPLQDLLLGVLLIALLQIVDIVDLLNKPEIEIITLVLMINE
tara:strand:- start:523 stop:768 length:246 start_codon:yes stop_codon:yes gene_type:complete